MKLYPSLDRERMLNSAEFSRVKFLGADGPAQGSPPARLRPVSPRAPRSRRLSVWALTSRFLVSRLETGTHPGSGLWQSA